MKISAAKSNVPRMLERLAVLMHVFPWVQMVVFSELAAFGPLLRNTRPFPNATEAAFQKAAKAHGIWLLPGTMFERDGPSVFNTLSVIDPRGQIVGRYRKLFPFRPYEVGVEAGEDFLLFDVPKVGRFGVSICYDMWFPETSRTLAARGAEVILHPSLTGTIDRDVELAIAQATAAQNQCYIFDINGVEDGGCGRSSVVGPHGDVLYTSGTAEEMIPLEIDLERVRRSRSHGLRGLGQPLKSFRDRKVEFPIYDRTAGTQDYLSSLGALEMPRRPVPRETEERD